MTEIVDKPYVLVVDDDEMTRLIVTESLVPEGFAVAEAASGEEAIDCFLRRRPDLVLLDVSMPGMDGFACCEKIRQMPSGARVPILILTGHDDDASIARAFEVGATDFVSKPMRWKLLAHRARYLLRANNAVEDLARSEASLAYLATHDTLTGLPNRRLLVDRLQQAVAGAARQQHVGIPSMVWVAFLDIDNFKYINDSLGYAVGDKLLQAVAERLSGCVRGNDTVARLGEDDFVLVLCNETENSLSFHALERLLDIVAQPLAVGDYRFTITASIGCASYPQDGADAETLLQRADAAMYSAKAHGRGTFQFFTQEMHNKIEKRMQLEAGLRQALDRNEFELYYQPQFSIADGRLIGAEALLRWRHPERGIVGPGEFIDFAEESGMIVPIGERVLQLACAQNRLWQEQGLSPLPVAINLSARQFAQQDIEAVVERALRSTGLAPQYLELELTETVSMANPERTVALLKRLKQMGVGVSIDDFGTGYSNMSYLKRFPVNELKLDISFVREITTDESSVAIAGAIITMAHSLGLRVVAEGVETAAQLERLATLGCDMAQGYYFSRPIPAGDFEQLLRKHRLPDSLALRVS